MKYLALIAPIFCASAFPVFGAPSTQVLTYDIFEVSVPHMDLESCPETLQAENVFCRATLHHEELHVFAFTYDGDSPLVGFKTFSAQGIGSLLSE